MKAIVGGLFENLEDAHRAGQALLDSGISQESISLVTQWRHPDFDRMDITRPAVQDAEKGAVIGGLAGLFLGLGELAVPGAGLLLVGGWLATTLLGAGLGAVTGGLVGTLVEAGLSHEEASHFEEGVWRGGILITVKTTEDRVAMVESILRDHHAGNVHERAAQWQQKVEHS